MDRIFLNGLSFYGYHGVFEAEARLGQRFIVDLELALDLSRAAQSDRLEDTVNYADIFEEVRRIVEEERYQLIEALAGRIADRLLAGFPMDEVKVTVTKPHPPIRGHYDSVAVQLVRRKERG